MYTAVILYDISPSYPKILRPNNAALLLNYSRPTYNKRTKKQLYDITQLWPVTKCTVTRLMYSRHEIKSLCSGFIHQSFSYIYIVSYRIYLLIFFSRDIPLQPRRVRFNIYIYIHCRYLRFHIGICIFQSSAISFNVNNRAAVY